MPSVAAGIAALATGFAVEAGWLQGLVQTPPKAAHGGVTILVKIPPGHVGPPTVERASAAVRRDVRVASLDTDAAFDVADARPPSRGLGATFDERFRVNTGLSFGDRFAGVQADVATSADVATPSPRSSVATAAPRSSPAPAAPHGSAAVAIAKAIDEPRNNARNERLALADPSDDGHAGNHLGIRHAAISPSSPADSPKGKDETRPEGDDRIAIYDISAHTVYLPDGRRLEAHSGRGSHMDDPHAVNVKGQGPTPPNVYELSLRERIFHGIRAIRLTPVGEARMYGRDGMLAHTYMLGRNGASMGCVSFSDYPAFLNAYLKGEVNRLVVVEHLASAPNPKTASDWLPASVKSMLTRS